MTHRAFTSRRRLHAARLSSLVLILALAGAAVAASAGSSASGGSGPAASALSFRIDHFLCYRVDPTSKQTQHKVVLRDQFGTRKGVAFPLRSLCNPVRKNATGTRHPRAHLACYGLKSATAFRTRKVSVTNQLDRAMFLAVTAPQRLCLPTGKSLKPTSFPAIPKGLDHFLCYPVKPLKPAVPHSVKLKDQFGSFAARTLVPAELCNPVSKNRRAILNRRDHLVCYTLTPNTGFKPRRVVITNQFGKQTLVASATSALCVPSVKKVIP
jgi:hypothetical protein